MVQDQILLNDQEANPRLIAQEDQAKALAGGFKPPSQEQVDQYNLEQHNQSQYGEGVGNMAKSAALGFGESATFGLSNQALTKSGLVNPETIKQIEERNPGSHLAGELGGVL